jgi:uncharacterized membrane protein
MPGLVDAKGLLSGIVCIAMGAATVSADIGVTILPLQSGWTGSSATGISADGTTVVGSVSVTGTPYPRPARWVLGEGSEVLGTFPSGQFPRALGASENGERIFGVGNSAFNNDQGFRWDAPGPIQPLQVLTGYSSARPRGISTTGHFIAGSLTGSGQPNRAAIWNHAGVGMLLPLPAGATSTNAWTVADNRVTLGTASTAQGLRGVRWVPIEGTVEYFASEPFPYNVSFSDASHDATVVVGTAEISFNSFQPWRWTSGGGSELLPLVPGKTLGSIHGVSGDGAVMIGDNQTSGGFDTAVATVWLADGSVRTLSDYLTGAGMMTAGWTFTTATGISADGTVIVGHGVNPQGNSGGFVAVLPAPGAGMLGLAGLLAAGRRQRRTGASGCA